uniref:Peptidase S1 domain-containing protein n=1 Tax=Ditylenchus dipsaci TaxID=166011 RepID=A0A915D0K2_9BILA
MDTENDPLAQSEGFLKEKLDLTCTSKSLYCIHSAEEGNQKDGASGDSGTGIVGRRGHLAILHGWTIAGVDIWQLGIALRTQSLEYDICHYTGVCTEKSWVGKTEESKLKVKFSSYYVPALPENVVE